MSANKQAARSGLNIAEKSEKMRSRNAIKAIVNSRLFYILTHRILGFLAAVYDHIRIQEAYRKHVAFERKSAKIAKKISQDLVVLSGPFKGLQYPSSSSFGSALAPKILGCYESELHPILNTLKANYEQIFDFGCAEGYYAVGLALIYTQARVNAYDTDALALQRAHQMARLNNVETRISLHGRANWQDLKKAENTRSLIICDCEGYERLLFNHMNLNYLKNSDLIIELHDFAFEDTSVYLPSLFHQSHDCDLVSTIYDSEKGTDFQALDFLTPSERKFCVSEFRPCPQQWLICHSRYT